MNQIEIEMMASDVAAFLRGYFAAGPTDIMGPVPHLVTLFGLAEDQAAAVVNAWNVCDECDGAGEYETQRGGSGDPIEDVVCICQECDGTGKKISGGSE